METKLEILRNVLSRVYKENCLKKDFTNEDIDSFIFNMADWNEDLQKMANLYNNIDNIPFKEAEKIIIGFLIHAGNHITKAKDLIDEMSTPSLSEG